MIRQREVIWSIVVLAIAIGAWRNAAAFSKDNHEEITKEALLGTPALVVGPGPVLLPAMFPLQGGGALKFSEEAAKTVARANSAIDDATLGGFVKGTEPWHFDDSRLLDGTVSIDKRLFELKSVITSVPKGITARDTASKAAAAPLIATARSLFGFTLHTVQDFYAHSTWMERGGRPGGLSWGDALYATKPAKFDDTYKPSVYRKLDADGQNVAPCANGVAGPAIATAKVFSEYFLNETDNAASGQCVHGPSARRTCKEVLALPQDKEKLDRKLCAEIYTTALDVVGADSLPLNGLNKDKDSRPLFSEARSAAATATYQLALDLMRMIGDYDVNVLRLFLGVDLPELPEVFDGNFPVLQQTSTTLKVLSAGATSLEVVTQPLHGTVTVNSDGTFTYKPTGTYFGADQFTYRGRNAAGTSPPATVTLRIGRSFAGMWLITVRPASSVGCPLELSTSFYAEVFRVSSTQFQSIYRGSVLNLVMAAEDSPAGPSGSVSVTYNDGAGKTTENVTVQMPDSGSLSGTTNWSYQGPDGTCSGRTEFTGSHAGFY